MTGITRDIVHLKANGWDLFIDLNEVAICATDDKCLYITLKGSNRDFSIGGFGGDMAAAFFAEWEKYMDSQGKIVERLAALGLL